jgi:hypothetical protein
MDLTTMDYRKVLLDAAARYCKQHKITLSRLGKKLMNDHRFFTEMRDDDRGCTVDTFQRVMRELSEGPATAQTVKVGMRSKEKEGIGVTP